MSVGQITTLEDLRDCLTQCVELIRAIPQEQRTLSMKSLFNDLRQAIARYDDLKREEENP